MSKQDQVIPPWAHGPFELIRHANEHLKLAGDADRRIALIGFDNAIESCIDLFLSLHPKIRGNSEISNDTAIKAGKNFHTKLDFLYDYASTNGISVEVPIENVIWYHQLRNELYHSGHGLIPEIHVLHGARAAALVVFRSLFSLDIASMLGNVEVKTNIGNDDLGKVLGEDLGDLREISIRPSLEAQQIRDILRRDGHVLLMQSKRDQNRFYRACNLSDTKFGIQVVEWREEGQNWQVVTSYIRNKEKNLIELEKYLRRIGGVPFHGNLPKPILV